MQSSPPNPGGQEHLPSYSWQAAYCPQVKAGKRQLKLKEISPRFKSYHSPTIRESRAEGGIVHTMAGSRPVDHPSNASPPASYPMSYSSEMRTLSATMKVPPAG